MASGRNFSGGTGQAPQQPSRYQQPRNMMGGHRTYGRDRYSQVDNRALNRELQMGRSAGRVASQAAPNLYNPGADTQAVSAVFGNEIGLGNNDPYLLHQLRGGGYAVNRGLIDPTLVNLTGDYSKWIT